MLVNTPLQLHFLMITVFHWTMTYSCHFLINGCISFLGLLQQSTTNWVALHSRGLISHRSGSWESGARCQEGRILKPVGRILPGLFLASAALPGVPRLVGASPSPPFLHGILPGCSHQLPSVCICVLCPKFPFL